MTRRGNTADQSQPKADVETIDAEREVTISTENEVEMVSPDNESGKKKNGVSDDE
jgi:hypothetical protein